MTLKKPSNPLKTHEQIMAKVLQKAKQGLGKTIPNPATAACIIKDGHIIAWGVHQKAGLPHAERLAIAAAGPATKGATLYVNLEPCTHHGRTPPCVDAIIQAGIIHVIYAANDPNPKVYQNPAVGILQNAGIQVTHTILAPQAEELNKVFYTNQRKNRPFVRLKAAMTLDGKIALSNGQSKYLTGPKSRQKVHQLRKLTKTILIGYKTILVDDPKLNIRLNQKDHSLKTLIIIDPHGKTPENAQFFTSNPKAKVYLVTKDNTQLSPKLTKKVTQWKFPTKNSQLPLDQVLKMAYQEGICDILIEGGPGVYSTFIQADLVDEYYLFYAPMLMGGVGDFPVLALPQSYQTVDEVPRLKLKEVTRVGDDILIVLKGSDLR